MITCEEIYGLHTTGALKSALYEAYREIPLDSRNSMRKMILLCIWLVHLPMRMRCAYCWNVEQM